MGGHPDTVKTAEGHGGQGWLENGGVRVPNWEVMGTQKWKVRVRGTEMRSDRRSGRGDEHTGMGWDRGTEKGNDGGMKVEGKAKGDEGCDTEVRGRDGGDEGTPWRNKVQKWEVRWSTEEGSDKGDSR